MKQSAIKQSPIKKLGPWQMLVSVLAAMLGVQSDANRERDFHQGKAGHFIIGGILAVICFVLALYLTVSLVLG